MPGSPSKRSTGPSFPPCRPRKGFPRAALVTAYADTDTEHTDDAALFAAAGHEVRVIEGDPLAFKITTPWDLRRAELLVERTPVVELVETSTADRVSTGSTTGVSTSSTTVRTGIGVDVHAYDSARPLWLGGVYWPDEVGLAGHSDGDAIVHAICDALLSAAGLGDMGSRFGTSDPRFENAHGEVFLSETLTLVHGAGFAIANVAVQVIGNTPRLSAAARRDRAPPGRSARAPGERFGDDDRRPRLHRTRRGRRRHRDRDRSPRNPLSRDR